MQNTFARESVLKNVLRFSLPYLLSYFLQTLYGMADLLIIGQFDGVAGPAAGGRRRGVPRFPPSGGPAGRRAAAPPSPPQAVRSFWEAQRSSSLRIPCRRSRWRSMTVFLTSSFLRSI